MSAEIVSFVQRPTLSRRLLAWRRAMEQGWTVAELVRDAEDGERSLAAAKTDREPT